MTLKVSQIYISIDLRIYQNYNLMTLKVSQIYIDDSDILSELYLDHSESILRYITR